MANDLTGRQLVLARVEVASRLGSAYQAERRGLVDALHYGEPRCYSPDADEQRTYERGYYEGRELLRAAGPDDRDGQEVA